MNKGTLCLIFSKFIWPQVMKDKGANEEKLQLLHELTGTFRPGVLTALMGVSGAGKTTLMDVLSGRKTRGYIEGDIRISGYPKKQETFARISGYCEQNDIHSPQVTVSESLMYSAFLRLPKEVSKEEKMARTCLFLFTHLKKYNYNNGSITLFILQNGRFLWVKYWNLLN